MEILLSCRQNITTHIMDHIHEWHCHCSLCKIQLDYSIFLDWFLKALFPPSPRTLHLSSHKLRRKPSSRHNSSILSTPNRVICIPTYLMLPVLAPHIDIRQRYPMFLMDSLALLPNICTYTWTLFQCHLISVTPIVLPNLVTPLIFHV